MTLIRRLVAEGLGTAFLLAIVIGSGIMAERLADGNAAIALLANAISTGTGLVALILMFGEPLFFASEHVRTGAAQWWSEFIATFGLLGVIIGCSRSRPALTPFAVAAYITAAYWFTSSTSFSNPAVTLARSATNTFVGIRPIDAPAFIIAQLLGAAAATWIFCWLYPAPPRAATVGGTVAPSDFSRHAN